MIDDVEAVGHRELRLVFGAQLGFFQFNIILIGQPAQGFGIRILFMFHQKSDGITAFSTTEAFVNLFRRRYSKRRCFFVVKRANTEVIGSSFFEFYKGADDFNDIDPALNLLYGMLRNQGLKITRIFGTGNQ